MIEIDSEGVRTITRELILEVQADPPDFTEIDALIAECRPIGNGGFPGRYPVSGSIYFVDTFSAMGYGKAHDSYNGNLTPWSHWKITVTYKPVRFEERPDTPANDDTDAVTVLERSSDVGGYYMTLPGQRLYWENDTKPILDESVPASKKIDVVNYRYVKHFVTDAEAELMVEKARALSGQVNEADFSDTDVVFPGVKAETLLLEGASKKEVIQSDGTRRRMVEFRLMERVGTLDGITMTWNHIYDSGPRQTIRKVFRDKKDNAPGADPQSKPLYETSANQEFIDLFKYY